MGRFKTRSRRNRRQAERHERLSGLPTAVIPQLEGLEPRLLLSTVTVSPQTDLGDGAVALAGSSMTGVMPAGTVALPGDSGEAGTRVRVFDLFGGTWTDAEKDATSTEDDLLCWAATASNLLEYTGWGFVDGMTNADQMLDYFEQHWKDVGETVEPALKWWFDGVPTGNVDVAGGGFYPDLNYANYFSVEDDNPDIMSFVDSHIRAGSPVGLWVLDGFNHEITCWGFNYDPAKAPGDVGYYLGVWVTDSDDNKGEANGYTAPNHLHYYNVVYDGAETRWEMPDYGGGPPDLYINQAVSLQRAAGVTLDVNGDQGSVNQADAINVSLDATGNYLEIRLNGTLIYNPLVSTIQDVNIKGWGGNDTLTIDMTNGDPLAGLNFTYDGGAGTDTLAIVGTGTQIGSYNPATTAGAGTVQIGNSTITFTGLEPVTVSGLAEFTFVTPNSNDVITVDSPAAGQNRISGTSGGVAFESVTFTNVARVKLDTATNDGPLALSNDTVTFTSDLVATGLTSFTVDLGAGNDTADASAVTSPTQPVTLLGGDGDDILTGGAGNDRLEGGDGQDVLNGSAGSDSLLGGAGSDIITAGTGGADSVDGGTGDDSLNFADGTGNYTISQFVSKAVQIGRATGASAIVTDVEEVNVFAASPSTYHVYDLSGTSVVTVNIGASRSSSVVSFVVPGAVTLDGTPSGDTIDVTLNNGLGFIAVLPWGRVQAANTAVSLSILGLEGNDTITVGNLGTTTVTLDGGAGDDTLSGTAGNDTMNGGDGNDTFIGNGGTDTVTGGNGTDTVLVSGTAGNDTISVTEAAGAHTVVNGGVTTIYAAGSAFERLLVQSGDGTDTVTATGAVVGLLVEAGAGNDMVNASAATTDVVLLGGAGDDTLFGGSGNDRLEGGDGNDQLNGLAGSDVLDGGAGNDDIRPGISGVQYERVMGGDGDDLLFLSLAGGTTTFTDDLSQLIVNYGSNGTVAGGVEAVRVLNTAGAMTINVGDLAQTSVRDILLQLNDGGAASIVTVDGSSLNDEIHVSQEQLSTASPAMLVPTVTTRWGQVAISDGSTAENDSLVINGLAGNDTIKADGNVTTGGGGAVSTLAVTLNGDDGDDVLSGDARLNGNAGNDILIGGAGNDTMDGGAGDDTFIGNGGTDAIGGGTGISAGDSVLVQGTPGDDTISITQDGSGFVVTTMNGLTTTYTNFIGGPFATSGVERILVQADDGDDTISVTSLTGTAVNVDGGLPTASDTLNVTSATVTVNLGSSRDSGVLNTSGGDISYTGIEAINLTGTGAGGATVNGTNADNAINQSGNVVTVDNYVPITLVSGYTTLTLNGMAGSDTINVNPGSLTAATAMTVNGGDPTGSDTLIINGTPAVLNNLRYNPSNAGAGTVVDDNTAQPPIAFTGIEHLKLVVQQADGDGVRFEGTTGNDTVEFHQGATADSGVITGTMDSNNATGNGPFAMTEATYFGVNSLANDVDLGFYNPGGTDSFVFNGTAGNDLVAVGGGEAGGTEFRNTINGQVWARFEVFNYASALVRGLDGDDTFNVAPRVGVALRLEGGDPSASDVLNFTGDGTGAVTEDLGAQTIAETGFGTVTLSGIELVNLNAGGAALTIQGTANADTMRYTPTGVAAGIVTLDGLNQVTNFTNAGGTFTLDPLGGSDTVVVNGTSVGDTIDVVRGSPFTTVQVDGMQTVRVDGNAEALSILAGLGDDTINVSGSENETALNVDGGLPTASDTLNVTSGNVTVNLGNTNDSGVLNTNEGNINYTGIEAINLTDDGDGLASIIATNANNAITQYGNTVAVDNYAPISISDFGTLRIVGMGGDDTFNLSPEGLTGAAALIADGADPTASDTVIVNGTGNGDDIGYAPTGSDNGTITINAFPPVSVTGMEHLIINGQGGGDDLTVAMPSGRNTIALTPGTLADQGTISMRRQWTNLDLLGLNYLGIGRWGSLTFSNLGGGRYDRLTINGTQANDLFTVDALGEVHLSVPALNSPTLVPVYTPGILHLLLNGLDGDDTFNIDGPVIFDTLDVSGGDPSHSDILVFNGSGGDITVGLGTLSTVQENGGGLVSLTGVEQLNVNADDAGLTIDGTDGPDTIRYTPTNTFAGTVTMDNLNLVTNFDDVVGTFLIDPLTGSDTVVVYGTSFPDTINVVRGLVTDVEVVGLKAVDVDGDAEAISILAGLGDDTINVSGSGSETALYVDGGDPKASDTLSIAADSGETIVKPGSTPDSGVVATPGNPDIAFAAIEDLLLAGPSPAAPATLSIYGRLGSDLIKLYGGESNRADVNDRTPVDFSGYGTVVLYGLSGNDTYNISPVGLVGVNQILVHATDPIGTSDVIVNGSSAGEDILVTALDETSATVTVGTSAPVTVDPVTSLTVKGLAGNDAFTLTGATPLDAPITLDGGTGNDTFTVGAYTGDAVLSGAQGSDTVDFSTAPAGVTIDLDLLNVIQQVNRTGLTIKLLNAMENFVGSPFNDQIYADALMVDRLIDGGNPARPGSGLPPAPIPPGDFLSFDGQNQNTTVTHGQGSPADADNGTATAFGYATVTFTSIEKMAVTNSLSQNGLGAGGTGAFAFTSAVDYPMLGASPTAIALGDLNGDGYQDMVTVNKTGLGVASVRLGLGDGTFGDPTGYATVLKGLYDVELVDMDNDGDLDIVTAGKGAIKPAKNSVVVLFNDGTGAFSGPTVYATNLKGTLSALSVGDVDHNDTADVLIGTKNQLMVLKNSGSGTLTVPPMPMISGGKKIRSVSLTDVTGDGYLDILALSYKADSVSVFVNAGTFNPGYFTSTPTGSYTTGKAGKDPTSMVLADFNNDGYVDVAVSNSKRNAVSVLLGNGNGTFSTQQMQAYYLKSGFFAIAAGDVNGDGKQDLVIGHDSTPGTNGLEPRHRELIDVLIGNGNGTFSDPYTFATGDLEELQPAAISLADFNLDGGLDIAIVNSGKLSNSVSVLLKAPTI
jgi:Ca2+-binding RTX toxin-like protein